MNESNVKIIENARLGDVQAGDYLIRTRTKKYGDADITEIREGIARHRNEAGIWCTEGGMRLAFGEGKGITLTIRRAVQELPTEPGTVIVPADGHERIEASECGETRIARDAVLRWDGRWYGVWRSGDETYTFVSPGDITPGTWKMEEN